MGYQIVEDMELLGFTIYKDTSKITNNWAKVVEKLTKKYIIGRFLICLSKEGL